MMLDVYKDEKVRDLAPDAPSAQIDWTVEQFIFGTETDLDRTRIFHGPRTHILTQRLIDWFVERVGGLL